MTRIARIAGTSSLSSFYAHMRLAFVDFDVGDEGAAANRAVLIDGLAVHVGDHVKLGALAYGLPPDAVTVAEGADFLRALERPVDVVSCFSVLHHFVLGAGSCSAEELIELLDHATGRVLLLDTGEAHEAWFRELLPAWSSEFVGEWLSAHTTFRDVVALGTDRDDVPPFEENYGRTLFACVR